VTRALFGLLVLVLVLGVATQSARYGADEHYIQYQRDGINYIPDLPGGAAYVAMGDSYSATGSWRKRIPLDLCARNADDLGHVVAQLLQPVTFTDRACSGADLDSLYRPTKQNDGAPQVYGVGPFTRLVTVLVGANALGYGGVITHCFVSPDAGCAVETRRNLPGSSGWNFVRAQYGAVIDLIRRLSAPDVRVVLIGYLPLFSAAGPVDPGCLRDAGIPAANVELWRPWYAGLQELVRQVAADRNAQYIAPPADHPACSPQPYTALRGVDLSGHGPDAYGLHPTIAGQRALGNLIDDRIRGRNPHA
jgi:hypothetical protein